MALEDIHASVFVVSWVSEKDSKHKLRKLIRNVLVKLISSTK